MKTAPVGCRGGFREARNRGYTASPIAMAVKPPLPPGVESDGSPLPGSSGDSSDAVRSSASPHSLRTYSSIAAMVLWPALLNASLSPVRPLNRQLRDSIL